MSPHLNGKVERSQKTDLDEFYSSIDIRSIELPKQLHNWEHYYNHNRGHTSLLLGKHLGKNIRILNHLFLSIQEIEKHYDPLKEPLIIHKL
ncbi:integrase core domain protein [Rickettsia hoogstraalii str. RCCE3]|nr:integrase core domain protein [Rickettsia hoogstraalii str. RCCE3]